LPVTGAKKIGYWLVAFLLAGVLLYFSLRGIEWHKVWLTLARANVKYLAAAIGISTVALFLRSLRWRVLLRAEAPVTVGDAFWATSAGYFGNNFLPARAGEVVRSLMISSRWGISRTFVLTTALSERVCDAIVLVVVASLVLLVLPVKPGWFQHAATPFGVLGLCGILGIALLPRLERLWVYLLRAAPLSAPLLEKLLQMMSQVLNGIRAFHDRRRLMGFVSLTCVIWICDSLATMIGAQALGLKITVPVAFLLITGLGLGSALPSTPGYVGIYQFVAVSILTLFGLSKTDAIAYILMAQALQYILITFWGLIAFTKYRGISPTSKLSAKPEPITPVETFQ
jgi:uncharacterized protein (TIRG00374 family)